MCCPKCGSHHIMTERSPNGSRYCLFCRHRFKIGESQPKQTVFDQITESPETLAESVVYTYEMAIGGSMFRTYWTSPFVENFYPDKSEAIAATLEKLTEVVE